jgi:retinol dehydrogenase-12
VLLTREIVQRLPAPKPGEAPPVIINIVNPGLCSSNLDRSGTKQPLGIRVMRWILDRTTEVGGRTLVLAASAPASSHGEFQSDGKNQDVEGWIYTDLGKKVQRKVWEQTVRILETRRPGIVKDAGLVTA